MKKISFNNRNVRYMTAATVITVLFIAAVIILNVILTSVLPFSDLSSARIYSLTPEFEEHFESVTQSTDGTGYDINFVAMSDESTFRSGKYTLMVYRTIKEIERAFDNVHFIFKDTVRHPELAEEYMLTPYDNPAYTDIAIELADKNGERLAEYPPRICAINSFYVMNTDDSTVYAYNAESKILSVVMQLLNKAERPTAYYLLGHGEPTLAEASDWSEVLDNAGYNVKEITLINKDDKTGVNEQFYAEGDNSHNSDILIINAPKYDLFAPTVEDSDIISEKKLIDDFLVKNKGNLIVTVDASTQKLPVLSQLLSEWGLSYGNTVTDSVHSVQSSGNVSIKADYDLTKLYYETNSGEAYPPLQILQKILGDMSNPPISVFSKARIINIDGKNMIKGVNGSSSAYGLLYPYKTASVENPDVTTALLGFAVNLWDVNDKNATKSYVVLVGTTEFLSYGDLKCANRDVIYALLGRMRYDAIYFDDVEYKVLTSEALTIDESQAKTWSIICVAVVPALFVGAGIFVWVRRRHS